MNFRDDHEAALARLDALEAELANERAERRRLAALLAERDRWPPLAPAREASVVETFQGEERRYDIAGLLLLAITVAAFALFLIAVAMA